MCVTLNWAAGVYCVCVYVLVCLFVVHKGFQSPFFFLSPLFVLLSNACMQMQVVLTWAREEGGNGRRPKLLSVVYVFHLDEEEDEGKEGA
ncbi:hypothetical protein B0H63DRAFT_307206 [Podospora didyma]|uniref:Uncharacterized protein n=1 Tax=Podospora didyma TaxID=330526 RepID=A0AAE0N4P8_9PEZI|nr:hypothetical protein B0H63DRAFT_307206 [Podospora didyma]